MILSGLEIVKRLNKDIFIENFNEDLVNPNSYNLTLNEKLLVYDCDVLDMKKDNVTRDLFIPEEGLVLLPGELYLGRVNERTKTKNLVPMLEGRSSIGRLGIEIHVSAGFGDVGFDGYWTLEITCVRPVRIYANVELCQMYFHTIEGEFEEYQEGKYQGNNSVQASMLWKDFEQEPAKEPLEELPVEQTHIEHPGYVCKGYPHVCSMTDCSTHDPCEFHRKKWDSLINGEGNLLKEMTYLDFINAKNASRIEICESHCATVYTEYENDMHFAKELNDHERAFIENTHRNKERIPIKAFNTRVRSGSLIECTEAYATTVSCRVKDGLTNGHVFAKVPTCAEAIAHGILPTKMTWNEMNAVGVPKKEPMEYEQIIAGPLYTHCPKDEAEFLTGAASDDKFYDVMFGRRLTEAEMKDIYADMNGETREVEVVTYQDEPVGVLSSKAMPDSDQVGTLTKLSSCAGLMVDIDKVAWEFAHSKNLISHCTYSDADIRYSPLDANGKTYSKPSKYAFMVDGKDARNLLWYIRCPDCTLEARCKEHKDCS